MPPTCYPIALVLDGKRCLVVGGGEIADGKLDALLLAGAVVTVVSPEVRSRIAALAADGQITLHLRSYQTSDLDDTYLAIAATDDRPTNARMVTEARAAGILTQAVDDIPGGAQITMLYTFEVEGGEKPVCVAETLARVYAAS